MVTVRRLLGKRGDEFQFTDVFGQRSWQSDKYPAAALHGMRSHTALKVCKHLMYLSTILSSLYMKFRRTDAAFLSQKYFESWTLVEHQPLSQEGYAKLKQDIAR